MIRRLGLLHERVAAATTDKLIIAMATMMDVKLASESCDECLVYEENKPVHIRGASVTW